MKFPPIIRSVSGNLTKDLRGAIGSLLLDDPPRPPVLVFGSQNSGTTIFGEAVSSHPAIANRSERALLWDRFHRSDRSDVFRTAEDAGFWDRVRIRGNFAYYHVQSGKPVILNKLPHNALRIHYLKEIFPDARLLHIVRDPRATVRSNLDSIRSTPSRQHRPFGGFTRPRNWRE